MSIHLSGPRIVDLTRGTLTWEASTGCCDLCREDAPLYRLLESVDALCERCFGMWHG